MTMGRAGPADSQRTAALMRELAAAEHRIIALGPTALVCLVLLGLIPPQSLPRCWRYLPFVSRAHAHAPTPACSLLPRTENENEDLAREVALATASEHELETLRQRVAELEEESIGNVSSVGTIMRTRSIDLTLCFLGS